MTESTFIGVAPRVRRWSSILSLRRGVHLGQREDGRTPPLTFKGRAREYDDPLGHRVKGHGESEYKGTNREEESDNLDAVETHPVDARHGEELVDDDVVHQKDRVGVLRDECNERPERTY